MKCKYCGGKVRSDSLMDMCDNCKRKYKKVKELINICRRLKKSAETAEKKR